MKRASIDKAALAQLARRDSVLRDVRRSGGRDVWSHLLSHGHHYQTIMSCIRQGFLTEPRSYHYELTDEGRAQADLNISWAA